MKKIIILLLMLAPMSVFAQKFAHFNVADIYPNMKEYKDAQTELQNMAKQYDDDLKLMQDEFQKKAEEFEKEKDKLLENVRVRRETELQDLYQRLQQSANESHDALEKAEQEKMNAINDLVMAALKKVGEAGGYVYIVNIAGGAIPFINTSLSTDVTPDIKKALGIQ